MIGFDKDKLKKLYDVFFDEKNKVPPMRNEEKRKCYA
jgi:hypothetical protein